MKKTVLKRWLAALRSGEYQGCKHVLHDGKGFCALGVLLDTEVDDWWIKDSGEWGEWRIASSDSPYPLFCKLGLTDSDVVAACNMNDFIGYNLKEMADWLEKRFTRK